MQIDGEKDMNDELFRKSSLESLNSGEKLDTYIEVTNPGAGFLVTGILIMLVCAAVWIGASDAGSLTKYFHLYGCNPEFKFYANYIYLFDYLFISS